MPDLIPDEERESLMVALHNEGAYCGLCRFEDAIFEELDDDGRVEWRCEDCEKRLTKYVDAILIAFRPVSPVTREAVKQMLAENGFTPNGGHPHSWRCEHPDRYPGACRCVDEMTDDILALLSVSPPAEGNTDE